MTEPIAGEYKRFQDAVIRLRSHMIELDDCVAQRLPTTATRQAVTTAAAQVSNHAAVIDAMVHLVGEMTKMAAVEDKPTYDRSTLSELVFTKTPSDRGSDAGWNVYLGVRRIGWIADDGDGEAVELVEKWNRARLNPRVTP